MNLQIANYNKGRLKYLPLLFARIFYPLFLLSEAENLSFLQVLHLFHRFLVSVQPPQIIFQAEIIEEYR